MFSLRSGVNGGQLRQTRIDDRCHDSNTKYIYLCILGDHSLIIPSFCILGGHSEIIPSFGILGVIQKLFRSYELDSGGGGGGRVTAFFVYSALRWADFQSVKCDQSLAENSFKKTEP